MEKSKRGFTLIEVIIYLALFSMLIGGIIVVAYTIFESAGRDQARELLQQEGNFLTGKIEWALSGANAINNPPVDTPLDILQVTKYGGLVIAINTSEDCSGSTVTGNIFLQNGTNCTQLNSSGVQMSNLSFSHNFGGGAVPENVTAKFTLTTRTQNGIFISQDFYTTKYLRK
jgi:prepilin-type N-terminal cleavage/methylation domain-containing protein